MKLLTPTKGRVLVEPIKPDGESVAGIIIPEAHRDTKSSEAVVVRLGVGCKAEVKIGDRILMNRFSGEDIIISNRPYKMLATEDILATIE